MAPLCSVKLKVCPTCGSTTPDPSASNEFMTASSCASDSAARLGSFCLTNDLNSEEHGLVNIARHVRGCHHLNTQ